MAVTNAEYEKFFKDHEAEFRQAFYGSFDLVENVRSVIFNEEDIDSDVVNHTGYGDLDLLDRFDLTNQVQYDNGHPLWDKTLRTYEWAKAVSIPRKTVRLNKYQDVINRLKNLGRSTARTIEHFAMGSIDGCSSTTFSFRGQSYDCKTPDSIGLCASGHKYAPGAGVSGTQSNAAALALTPTNLQANRLAMVTMKGYRGEKDILIQPDVLLVPEILSARAHEIVYSMQQPDTGNNNINTLNPGIPASVWKRPLRIVTSQLLTDGASEDVSKWFLIDSSLAKESAHLLFTDRVTLEEELDFETKRAKFSTYSMFGLGFTEWRWIYGSFPS